MKHDLQIEINSFIDDLKAKIDSIPIEVDLI